MVAQWPETGIRDPPNQAEASTLNGAALSESDANEIRKRGKDELQPWAARQLVLCLGPTGREGGRGAPEVLGMRMLLSWQEREQASHLS